MSQRPAVAVSATRHFKSEKFDFASFFFSGSGAKIKTCGGGGVHVSNKVVAVASIACLARSN